MNFKKLLSASLAGIMALSMITAVNAEETVAQENACGTQEYELLYYNGFDTEEEKAKNPFKYYTYSSNTETPISATNSGKIQFTLYNRQGQKEKAVFFDIEEAFKDANNTSLLTAGELYEISFDLVVNWGQNRPSFAVSPQKSFESMKNAGGIGLNGTRYTLASVSGKREEEVKLIVPYNPQNKYLTITDYEYYFSPTATVDNLTLRKINVNEKFIQDNCETLYNKLTSSSAVTMTNIAKIDLSSTKNVLTKGETTDLIAYAQSLPDGATTADVIKTRQLIDNGRLTVSSSDESVAAYIEGKIKAGRTGTAVVTVSDGTNESKLLVIVHDSEAAKLDFLKDRPITWINVTDPTNESGKASACKNIIKTTTEFDTAEPMAIHYKKYFNGTEASLANVFQPFHMIFGSRDMTSMLVEWGNYDRLRTAYKKNLTIGWNDITIVSSYADGNKNNSIKFFVNGVQAGEIWYDVKTANTGKGVVEIQPAQDYNNAYAVMSTWDIYRELEIVSLKAAPEIKSVSVENGEAVSALGNIIIEFFDTPTIEDGAITISSASGTVDCNIVQNGTTVTVKPIGLKPNTNYKLLIDKSKMTANGMAYGTTVAEYDFVTDNTNISAVMGEGYVVTNALSNCLSATEEDGSHKFVKNDNAFVINALDADPMWAKGDIKPSRYKISMDVKNGEKTIYDMIHIVAKSGSNDVTTTTLGNEHGLAQKAESYDYLKVSDIQRQMNQDVLKWKEYTNVELTFDVTERTETNVTYNVKAVFTQGDTSYELAKEGLTATGDITSLAFWGKFAGSESKYYYVKNVNIYAGIKGEADYELSAIDVKSGEEVISANTGLNSKNITVAYTLKNNKLLDNQPYAAIAAVYEAGTQKMVAVDVKSGNVKKGETAEITNNLDLTKFSEGNYVLKVIIWNSLSEAKPVVNRVIDPFAE